MGCENCFLFDCCSRLCRWLKCKKKKTVKIRIEGGKDIKKNAHTKKISEITSKNQKEEIERKPLILEQHKQKVVKNSISSIVTEKNEKVHKVLNRNPKSKSPDIVKCDKKPNMKLDSRTASRDDEPHSYSNKNYTRDYFFLIEAPLVGRCHYLLESAPRRYSTDSYQTSEERKELAQLKLGVPLSNSESILKTAEWVASCQQAAAFGHVDVNGGNFWQEPAYNDLDVKQKNVPVKALAVHQQHSIDAIRRASTRASEKSSYFQPIIKCLKID